MEVWWNSSQCNVSTNAVPFLGIANKNLFLCSILFSFCVIVDESSNFDYIEPMFSESWLGESHSGNRFVVNNKLSYWSQKKKKRESLFEAQVLPTVMHYVLSCFSYVQLFVIPWTVAHWAPLSMGFPRQEYWSGLPCSPPRDHPDPGTELASLMSPALAGRFFIPSATWEAPVIHCLMPFFFFSRHH